jgi:hypothetical protein
LRTTRSLGSVPKLNLEPVVSYTSSRDGLGSVNSTLYSSTPLLSAIPDSLNFSVQNSSWVSKGAVPLSVNCLI